MPTRASKRKRAREQGTPFDKQKGNLLEDIAASLHAIGGVKAETRRFLPSRRVPSEKREIDVLLTVPAGIHTLQFAVECKNWKRRVDPDDIAAFKDKLEDIGLPVRPSYYVCVNGYTSGARRRAEEHGIELFTLEGLNAERVASKLHEAMQLAIFYVCWVERIVMVDGQPGCLSENSLQYYGPDGGYLGTAADILWEQWVSGSIPLVVGERVTALPLPDGAYHLGTGERTGVQHVGCVLRIQANVMSIPGTARHHVLRSDGDNTVKAGTIQAKFNLDEVNPTIIAFEDETELREYVESRGSVRIENWVRVPRIVWLRRFYWPPSRRVTRMLRRDAGATDHPIEYRFADVEGTALATAWEPIWSGHFHGGEPVSELDEEDDVDEGCHGP